MQDFIGKKILLGLCGGVAVYKSAYLVRELTRLGAEVKVVMTQSAKEFISPMLMQALSGQEVRCHLFDEQAERGMGHIELARWADCLVIAPASANCMAKLAQGLADDLLSTLYLVAEIPIVICPAMNRSMWAHPATQANYHILKARGHIFVGPEEGSQACGEQGLGRVSEAEQIITALRLLDVYQLLSGKKVVITAGPTREILDPVRYLTNRSSGKMGYALAEAAAMAGAEVTLISGPCALSVSSTISLVEVESANEMLLAVQNALEEGCVFIGAAAVADYRLETPSSEKIKKTHQEQLTLNLVKNPDILTWVSQSKKATYVVGFAAETQNVLTYARDKLTRKKIDMIVANQVGDGLVFDKDENEVTILTANQHLELAKGPKIRIAGQIIAILAAILQNEHH